MANSEKPPTGHSHYIIPILGPTGSGKGHFVNQLFGRTVARVGHSINSYISDMHPVEVPASLIEQYLPDWDHQARKKLIIVDTPGFDDTGVLEAEVLKRLAGWLAHSYGPDAKLAGAIYLHDISQCRVTGATKRNLPALRKLCGADSFQSVVLGTTKWSRVPDEELAIAEGREQLLRESFWKDMISEGSKVKHVDPQPLSAWKLIAAVLSAQPPLILVLGLTGTGKSSFILSAKPCGERPHVTSGGSSSVAPVQAFEVSKGTRTVLLVDTPGFNNTEKLDKVVLNEIVSWLKSRKKEEKVAGVIYLVDTSNKRYAPLTIEELKNVLPVALVKVQCHDKGNHTQSINNGQTVWNAIGEVLAHETRVPVQSVALEGILNYGSNGTGTTPGLSAFLRRKSIFTQ